jgi:hypothetical protein
MSPTARSLAHLRKGGALAQVVERYNPHAKRRVDLFGFIDIVALDVINYRGCLGVQSTTTENISHRLDKLRTECRSAMGAWLDAGNALHIHGWSRKGPRGQRKLWTLTERVITTDDLITAEEVRG